MASDRPNSGNRRPEPIASSPGCSLVNERVHLSHRRRWDDGRRGRAGHPRDRFVGDDRACERRAAPTLQSPSPLQRPLERRSRRKDLASEGGEIRCPAGQAHHIARCPRQAGDRRQGNHVRVREAAPRHGWNAAASVGRLGSHHLLPHLRRLPPVARGREIGGSHRGDRWRVYRVGSRGGDAPAGLRRGHARARARCQRAGLPRRFVRQPRRVLPR